MRRLRPLRPGSPGLRAVSATIALMLTGVVLWGWLRASPPGSSPDDDYHLASIWCADGYVDGRCMQSIGQSSVLGLVPQKLIETSCFKRRTAESAACLDEVLARPDDVLVPVTTNLDIGRADLYYRTANRVISDDIPASITRIRAFNAILVLTLVALTLLVATPPVRAAVSVSWLVASLPLGLFLVTSVNSTAWGLAGLGTVWANVLSMASPQAWYRRTAAAALAALGATMAIGSRTEALPHILVISVALAVLWSLDLRGADAGGRRPGPRSVRATPVVLGSIAGLALATLLLVRITPVRLLLDPLAGLGDGWDGLVARGIGNPLASLPLEVPQFWTGVLGSWNLGWLDTPMPAVTWVVTTGVFAGLATLGLQGARAGRIGAVIIVLAGLVALPTLSLISAGVVVQEEFQPRHYMALVYLLLGLALLRDPGRPALRVGPVARLSLAAALAIAHGAALQLNIRRYTNGIAELRYADVTREPEWWWAGGPSPTMTWWVTSVAFALAAYLVLGALRDDQPRGARA
jgi:hypothetical protein